MKKLFSLLIALVLAALCLSAVAEPLGRAEPPRGGL